jgi:hypothetical protein
MHRTGTAPNGVSTLENSPITSLDANAIAREEPRSQTGCSHAPTSRI